MKARHLLAAAAVLVGASACNGAGGNNASANETAANVPVTAEVVPPPEGGDWTQVVSKTPAGGFVMGNPNAAVKLVEFGSMTCPHCADFDKEGSEKLIDQYVKTGQVSYEFRNYIRDPFDLAAALIARCNGEKTFFALTHALYADQPEWVAKLQTVTPEQQQAIAALGPNQQFLEIAKLAGFQQWAAMRGIPTAKSTQCLTNEAEVNQLVQMNSDAVSSHNITRTPTFLINGEVIESGASWPTLEPEIRKALG